MPIHCLAKRAIALSAAAFILSACGDPQRSNLPSASGDQTSIRWNQSSQQSIKPDASQQDLLYFSSETAGAVYVYTYPRLRPVGTLTGFLQPLGECTNSEGDVFIVASASGSPSSSIVYEFAHGGTTPIATLNDPVGGIACSVDPKSGNLAVSGNGAAIYQHATGIPEVYHDSQYTIFRSCTYGNDGTLYLSAASNLYANQVVVLRLAAGSTQFDQMTINAHLYTGTQWPSLQWSGAHLTATSNLGREPITVYRFQVSGNNATVVGKTSLKSGKNDYDGQLWIQDKSIIGVEFYKRGYQNALVWHFPGGGEPKQRIKKVGNTQQVLWGVVVSAAKQ
jgi:hypothetical protein